MHMCIYGNIWLRPGGPPPPAWYPVMYSPPPPPWYPVMYSYTSISNGRHGVFSSSPVEQGYPSASAEGVLCSVSSGIPSPHPCGFVVFQLCVRAREEGEPAPPPGTGWFSLLPYTHTHHVFVNAWPFYLPTPLLRNRMVFPFALRHIHTHTQHVSVYVWHSLSAHALLLSLRSILWRWARGYDRVRHACRGGPPGLEASGPEGGGGAGRGGGRGGAENAQHTTTYAHMHTCIQYMHACIHTYIHFLHIFWTLALDESGEVFRSSELFSSATLGIYIYIYIYTYIYMHTYVCLTIPSPVQKRKQLNQFH